ncbi:helix-turn-helix domain-containing protein [Pseudohoeflea coraliihabitans]|uniref:XRE family transcriptional regulator n=1 Tax=Pseudohoeflea coraliihabitans TaxID=2860393 RepID=A0ABS6WTN9_9HYPH|nr:XRE family transcriptional regulator [Pseudohoeflea sp. DP4N28-3]MBW3099185.1 XRE family transcriptional regulator [Pseudohoeflea sp. DP4N28-3]
MTLPDEHQTGNPYALSIGMRIQHLRKVKGLSLSELSRRAQIAKGTLSRLETGRGNPTVMTLAALAAILEVTPSDFLPLAEDAPALDTTALSGPGVRMRFIHRTVTSSVWELYETIIPARPEPIVSKTHGGTEHLLMLTGEATVGPSEEPVLLRRGEHLSFAGHLPHLYWARETAAHLYLMMEYPLSGDLQSAATKDQGRDRDGAVPGSGPLFPTR